MNFKTTIMLFVALLVVGIIFVATNKTKSPTAQQAEQVTPGQGAKIVDLESSQVKGITVTDADGNKTSVRQDGAAWKMTAPVDGPAVDWQAQELIRTICDLRSQGRPDSVPSDAGLDKPRYSVDLIGTDGKDVHLVVGNNTSIGDTMYAKVDGGDVNLIDSSLAKTLKTAPDDLRDKHLLGTATVDYKQVRITTPTQTLEMQKQGDHWIITKPQQMPGDSESIASLISSVTGIEATEFVKSDSDDLAFARFDHPTMEVWLSPDEPTTQPTTLPSTAVTLTIGAADSLAKDHYFAKTSDGLIAKVAKASLDNLNKTPLDLRDRNVVSIAASDVSQISVVKSVYPPVSSSQATRPSVTNNRPMSTHLVVLNRRPKTPAVLGPSPTSRAITQPSTQPAESVWMLTIPAEPKSAVDDSKVETLLGKFSPLRADKYLEKPPQGAIDQKYLVTIETKSLKKYHIEVIKPGNGETTYGTYNGLMFELPTAFTDALDADFHKQP